MATAKAETRLSIPPLRLYLDDLHEIENVAQQAGFSVSYETDRFDDMSLDELLEKHRRTKTLHTLQIHIRRADVKRHESITLDIGKYTDSIHAKSDATEIVGIMHKIQQFVRGKSPFIFAYLRRPEIPLAILILACVVLGALGNLLKVISLDTGSLLGRVFAAITVPWMVITGWLVMTRRHLIILEPSSNSTFWTRKKDDLVADAIKTSFGIILGVVGGVGGTLLTQYLTSHPSTSHQTATSQPSR
jgi:hypothetical protein